jgi:hypothetical protein
MNRTLIAAAVPEFSVKRAVLPPATNLWFGMVCLWVLGPGLACAETVQLKADHGTFVVPVVLNDRITLNFTLDSGAADVSIPEDVFSTLVRAGTISKGDLLDAGQYQLADGSQATYRRFVIRSMRIGNVEIRNVIASNAPAAGPLLLGQTFLLRLQSWSIDNSLHILSINQALPVESEGAVGSEAAHDAPPAMQPAVATTPRAVQTNPTQASTQAPDWVLLGNVGTTAYYVDRTSLKMSNEVHQGWFKVIYAHHTEKTPIPGEGKKWIHLLMYQAGVNCGPQLLRTEATSWYYEDGSWFVTPTAAFPTAWESEAPDTIGDAEIKALCR